MAAKDTELLKLLTNLAKANTKITLNGSIVDMQKFLKGKSVENAEIEICLGEKEEEEDD